MKDFFIKQLNDILEEFAAKRKQAKYDELSDLKDESISSLITKSKAAVARIAGLNSEYYKDIENNIKEHVNKGLQLRDAMGPIMALKSDIEKEYIKSLSEIVQSEIFSNYIEMADYLLTGGYKDAATVIIGSTLEAHLKELSKSGNLPIESTNSKGKIIPIKADKLNSELAKTRKYSLAYQKQITAWIDLRNAAAHGDYGNYTIDQIKLMSEGVKQFMLNVN